MWKRLIGNRRTASRQQGDVHALDRPEDPRGGVQSEEYRTARPEDLVEEGETTTGGPGGAPRDELSPDERRERDRPAESA